MQTLNFSPVYEKLIRAGAKTLTVRAHNRRGHAAGERVMITIGGPDGPRHPLSPAILESVQPRKLGDLRRADLAGESPDAADPEALAAALTRIYRRHFSKEDAVWLIRFRLDPRDA
jgi:hypothetical protein